MGNERFDRFARVLATSSRRRVLGALAAGAVTTLLPRRAGALCQEGTFTQHPCGERECIGGQFVTTLYDAGTVCRPAAGPCDVAEVCNGSSLACPTDRRKPAGAPCDEGDICSGQAVCNVQGQCVAGAPLDCDDGNPCTADACDPHHGCVHTRLASGTPCDQEKVCCRGTCVDLKSDNRNCGRCRRHCHSGEQCVDGRCR